MPTVDSIIETHREEIVQRWAAEAQRSASGRGLEAPALRNLMPLYVASLTRLDDDPARAAERIQLIERHMAARLREGFGLDEMIEEVAILGRCIVGLWSGRPASERPDGADIERLFVELHRASVAIADAFAQHMADDEQTEKRYVRRLQAIASEVAKGEPRGAPLRDRLKDVLALVLEAMDAQAAALLLYDPTRRTLATAAAVGVASEVFRRYVTALGSPSFAAQVAAHEHGPTEVTDAATMELEVNDALRQSGLQALLGVRLPERHRLLGVLYVGLSTRRSFTPRDLRRIEVLGEQLTLHLDNAQLYAELRAQLEDLETERVLREHFVAVLAHDLRGPLTTARLGAQMLERDAAKLGDHQDVPARVVRSMDRADRMVRDLLDALLIRAGKPLPLQLAPCDLAEIARAVVDEAAQVHGPGRVVLRGDAQVPGYWSAADLQRALWNLVSNAIKYGAADAPVVVTTVGRPEAAEVSVHNEGAAISPGDQARLFKPFSQLRSAVDGRHGWGLGLTLVQGCVAAHGGRVELASAPGAGTTFTLRMPYDARPHQPPESS